MPRRVCLQSDFTPDLQAKRSYQKPEKESRGFSVKDFGKLKRPSGKRPFEDIGAGFNVKNWTTFLGLGCPSKKVHLLMDMINEKEFNKLKKKIYYILRQYSPKITPEQAEDCQQSVIMVYLQTYPSRNLRHLVIDYLRDSSGRKTSCNYQKRMDLNRPLNPHLIDRAYTIEDVNHKIDLNNFVSRLKPFYQTLIKYYLMGYTYPEIGALIGKTGGAVTVHFYQMHKVISKMKKS